MKKIGDKIPSVMFHTRVRNENFITDDYGDEVCTLGEYDWKDVTSDDICSDKNVIIFSLPGAFTPTCSTQQLPGFENLYNEFKEQGIDEIYCLSVNDAFVMNAWAESQKIKNVKVIPDGSGEFTKQMGMLVDKDNLGFGQRSWRYAMIVKNGIIDSMYVEQGKEDNCDTDPYIISSPENILYHLKSPQVSNS
jgi:peroxiredoxin